MSWIKRLWNKYMKASIENSPPPRDLKNAMYALGKIIDHDTRRVIQELDEEYISAELHHSLGRHIRNEWGLWKGSALQKWFRARGIWHADDMSGIIIASYWRQQHGVSVDLQGQIHRYQAYWAKQNQLEGDLT